MKTKVLNLKNFVNSVWIKVLEIYTFRTNVTKILKKKSTTKLKSFEICVVKSFKMIRRLSLQAYEAHDIGRVNTGIRCAQTFADTFVCLSFHPPVQWDTEHDLDPAESDPFPAEHCSGVPWGPVLLLQIIHSLNVGGSRCSQGFYPAVL